MSFFSVVIPVYNRSTVLSTAIHSVLQQSFADFELIITDDGSTDDIKKVVEAFQDSRIRYIYQQNQGVCAARNNGASAAVGEYITFLDSDDRVAGNWLADFYNVIKEQQAQLVFCNMQVHRAGTNTVTIEKAGAEGLYLTGTFCIRRECFLKAGGYDTQLKFGENSELSFRIQELKLPVGYTGNVALFYELNSGGGGSNLKNKIESNLYIIEKHQNLFKANPKVLFFYWQNIATAYLRLKDYKNASLYFGKSIRLRPMQYKTWMRWIMLRWPLMLSKFSKT
jgi:glycosyltransferase involved in cell wall biosynthesis